MATFKIKQGRDIRLKGAAEKNVVDLPLPQQAGVDPSDFKGLKVRLCVKVNDSVKVGSPLFEDKAYPAVKVVSPLSGKVLAINRGEKRFLLNIVIEADGRQEPVRFRKFSLHPEISEKFRVLSPGNATPREISSKFPGLSPGNPKDFTGHSAGQDLPGLSGQDITKILLEGGLWPVIRQRPFSRIAHPDEAPKSIFVHAMNTEPLAPDIDFILEGREERFQAGLDILKKLTKGKVYVCAQEGARSKALTSVQGVELHYFSGPHPSGNVSTHIHHLDSVHKSDHVWYIEAQDVLRIAALFLDGAYSAERIVALTGEGAAKQVYAKTIVGAPLSLLLRGSKLDGMRCISGSVLTGKDVGANGFLRFYDSQVTVIPFGGKRELLGWLSLGLRKYTFSRTFASSFLPQEEVSLTSDKNGSDRAIVLNDIYDGLVPLDIMTYFLLKAVIVGDIEEAEKLGILECDEEDFALCTFACPSKTDVGGIIREALDLIEKEG